MGSSIVDTECGVLPAQGLSRLAFGMDVQAQEDSASGPGRGSLPLKSDLPGR